LIAPAHALSSAVDRVLLVTGTHTLARGFQAFAAEHGNIEALVCTPEQVMSAVPESWQASIVLLDAPTQIDVAVVRMLRQVLPDCRIVLWTGPVSVETAHQARSAGVHGVLYKDSSDEPSAALSKCVVAGELWFPESAYAGTAERAGSAIEPP
jgi:DNA-binding NarL/FixJ family response regulator